MLSMRMLASGEALDTSTPTFSLWRETGEWMIRMTINAIEKGKRDGSLRPDLDAPLAAVHLMSGINGATLIQFGPVDETVRIDERNLTVDLTRSFLRFLLDAMKNPDHGE
jgi:hypothetical protein